MEDDKIIDSNGVEVRPGDLIECPKCPIDHAERYHIAALENGRLTIRDLGCNNTYMYDLWDGFINIGPFWKHLDKLEDEDLAYHFGLSRDVVERII